MPVLAASVSSSRLNVQPSKRVVVSGPQKGDQGSGGSMLMRPPKVACIAPREESRTRHDAVSRVSGSLVTRLTLRGAMQATFVVIAASYARPLNFDRGSPEWRCRSILCRDFAPSGFLVWKPSRDRRITRFDQDEFPCPCLASAFAIRSSSIC